MNKKLKKKYYREFLSYLRYLKNAGLILSGEFYKPRVEQKIQDIFEVVDKFIGQGPDLLQNVLDETERNLYSIAKDDKESYLTGILKDFIDIAPYLNDTDKKEPNDGSEGQIIQIINEKHHHVLDSCHELILRYELNYTEHFDNLTSPQQYVILCYRAYRDFFYGLNTMCIDFGIDIFEIQKKKEIQIFDRDMSSFQKFGLTGRFTHDKSNHHQNIKRFDQLEKEKKETLSINQIALLHVYQEAQITRENCNQIANEYGHKSGEKLYQRYTYYSSTANRKGKPISCTPKKLQNKINLIGSVIKILPKDKRGRAEDEVSILQNFFDSEYQ